MAVVSHAEKWIFLAEPHTASRACCSSLLKLGEDVRPHHVRPHQMDFSTEGYRLIAGCRNPYDVLITQWKRPSERNLPLDEFITGYWNHPSTLPYFANVADQFVWYENLQEDMNLTFGHVELDFDPKHKSEDKEDWWTYFDPQDFQRLAKRLDWKWYFKYFGYDIKLDGSCLINKPESRRPKSLRSWSQ